MADEGRVVSLVDSHTGKVVHQIECTQFSDTQICCLGWGLNAIDPAATKQLVDQLRDRFNLDDSLSQGVSPLASDLPTGLPTELAFLDIEGVLPKLSILPPTGKEYVKPHPLILRFRFLMPALQ